MLHQFPAGPGRTDNPMAEQGQGVLIILPHVGLVIGDPDS